MSTEFLQCVTNYSYFNKQDRALEVSMADTDYCQLHHIDRK